MSLLDELLTVTAMGAAGYRNRVAETPVFPTGVDVEAVRAALGSLVVGPKPVAEVIEELVAAVEPALVSSTGPRYFGFVIGGALEAATAADFLTSAWDQPARRAPCHHRSRASVTGAPPAGRTDYTRPPKKTWISTIWPSRTVMNSVLR